MWRTSAAPTSSAKSVTSFTRGSIAWSSAGPRRDVVGEHRLPHHVGRAADRLLDEAASAGACRCTRTGTARPRSASASRVSARSRSCDRPSGARSRAPRERCTNARRARRRRARPAPTARMPNTGRHEVADRRVPVVREVVAVEERVVPEARVVPQAVGHRAEVVLPRGSGPAGLSSPNAPPGARSPSGVSTAITPSPTNAHRQRNRRGDATSASVVGNRGVVDPQQRQVGALQVRDHSRGERELHRAGDGEVRERHRRDRLREMERRVQRRAVGAVEERRLQPELVAAHNAATLSPT